MNIKLHTINLQVADPEQTKRFYIESLGMKENSARSHPPGFIYLESPGANITLGASKHPIRPSNTVELGFETDDLRVFQSSLKGNNIQGFKLQSMGWGDVVEGSDPDGHRIIVYQFGRE